MRYRVRMEPLRHWRCPDCGRLHSDDAEAVWCLHQGTFRFMPPHSAESDWARMLEVVAVEVAEPVAVQHVVVEYQNGHGWRDDPARGHPALPGTRTADDEDWSRRIVSAPMPAALAYEEAASRPRRPGWPSHMHGFEVWPLDLAVGLG